MKEIINSEQMARTIRRMTHEIIENNQNLSDLVLIGILNKGLPLANLIKDNLKEFAKIDVLVYGLDISAFRDDKNTLSNQTAKIDINNKNVIIVDDVLYTGRSVKAALNALHQFGRANNYQLAVLIDRGHRELPISANYVGKNIPTSKSEKVVVDFKLFNVSLD